MFTRILGGLALVLAGSAMTLAATPRFAPAGEVAEGLARAIAEHVTRCDLPPGHPQVEACAPQGQPSASGTALPPGHPPVERRQLPPGHPPIDGTPRRAMPLPTGPEQPDSDGFPQGYLTTT
jgi:hypothetical protein